MSMEEDLASAIRRAELAEEELASTKKEMKEVEDFFQGENAKKEAEIRKLQESAIMKDKTFKLQKTELTQLQAEVTNLKNQLASTTAQQIDTSVVTALQQDNQSLKQTIELLKKDLLVQYEKISASEKQNQDLKLDLQQKEASFKAELQSLTNESEELRSANETLTEKLRNAESQKGSAREQVERKGSKKEIKFAKEMQERDRNDDRVRQLEDHCHKLEQVLAKYQKTIKELKVKNQSLLEEKETLNGKLFAINNANVNSQPSFSSPWGAKSFVAIQEESLESVRLNYSCLLLTKQHYISPFLEIYQQRNTLKIYKSTRAGTYEKSVGSTKHKFDVLTYEQQQIIEPIAQAIIDSQADSHSVIFYGVKKSIKKYLMAKLMVRLKDFLLEKLDNSEEVEVCFMKRSQEQEKNSTQKTTQKEEVAGILEKVIALGQKNEKPKEKVALKKTPSKPKVRYFSFTADEFSLQIGTSSFTGLSFRDKMTASSMLNNILYSKLPNVLQSSVSQKYLVLTLNPIVDLYEDCKNTLSTTICRALPPRDEQERQYKASPVKEELNDAAKKRLQGLERESEQTSLRIRKLEEECGFYRSRFDQLEFRLKGLLNTHSGQNSYLKKSPVTLSYEKLLKYVHSVQSRTSPTLNSQYGSTSVLLRPSHLVTEKEELDAL